MLKILNLKKKALCKFDPEINLTVVNGSDNEKLVSVSALSGDINQKVRTINLGNIKFDAFKFDISDIEVDLNSGVAKFSTFIEFSSNNSEKIIENLFDHEVEVFIDEKKSKMDQIDLIKNEIKEIALDEFSYAIENGFDMALGYEDDEVVKKPNKNKGKSSINKKISKFLLWFIAVLVVLFVIKIVLGAFSGGEQGQQTINQEIPQMIEQQVETQQAEESNEDLERETLSDFGLESDVSLK